MTVWPGRAPLPAVCWRAGLIVLLLWVRTAHAGRGDDAPYHLDARHPSVQQTIEPQGSIRRYRFVRIEVAYVTNPKRHPLTFELRYRSKDEGETFLGAFSLYPADNPGIFLVPTLGRLKDEGALLLTMVTPDLVTDQDALSVTVRRMTFVND